MLFAWLQLRALPIFAPFLQLTVPEWLVTYRLIFNYRYVSYNYFSMFK